MRRDRRRRTVDDAVGAGNGWAGPPGADAAALADAAAAGDPVAVRAFHRGATALAAMIASVGAVCDLNSCRHRRGSGEIGSDTVRSAERGAGRLRGLELHPRPAGGAGRARRRRRPDRRGPADQVSASPVAVLADDAHALYGGRRSTEDRRSPSNRSKVREFPATHAGGRGRPSLATRRRHLHAPTASCVGAFVIPGPRTQGGMHGPG